MPTLERIRINGNTIKIGQQIQMLRTMPARFTIRDVDLALSAFLSPAMDGHRSQAAERVIRSWLAIGEIRAVSREGLVKYVQQERRAA